MNRVTITDLAKYLNLSPSTISRALSDHPDISETTKTRVKALAEELNYTTNLHAKFFRSKLSGLIALIVPEMNQFFTPSIMQGVNKAIEDSTYSLIVFQSNDSHEKEKELVKHCISLSVEGILISLAKDTTDMTHLEKVVNMDVKCMLLDRTLDNMSFPSVTINNKAAAQRAADHLLAKGHRNILGIFGNASLSITRKRMDGFTKALSNCGLEANEQNMISVNSASDLNYILPPILNYNREITGIFCMSDELLSKTLFNIRKTGLRVPDDISLICISDGIMPLDQHPQISYIDNSGYEMGMKATRELLSLLHPESGPALQSVLPAELIDLESVRKLT